MTAHNQKLAYRMADTALRTVLRHVPQSVGERAALEWGFRYQPPPRTVRLRSGMRFLFESVDFLPLMLHYTGIFEPHMIAQLRGLIKSGDTVLDVGANVGFHTLESWNIVGIGGRVISIEASPIHAEAVRRNLALNDLPRMDVINVAVGDHDGEVGLGRPVGGNEGMYGINAGETAFTVPMRRIDDMIDVPSLALIKMDIEGSELSALKGAVETIRKHRPAILIELNETALARCGATPAEVISFLGGLGYTGSKIAARGLEPLGDGIEFAECLFHSAER